MHLETATEKLYYSNSSSKVNIHIMHASISLCCIPDACVCVGVVFSCP